MSAIPVFKIDLIDPNCGDLMFFGVRLTRYDISGKISNIIEKDYYISTPTAEAIEDLISMTDYGKVGEMR